MSNKTVDYIVENHGSIFLFRPQTPAAEKNLRDNVEDTAGWMGNALAVEHRYAFDLAKQLQAEGWVVK